MADMSDLAGQLALFALGESLRARAELIAIRVILKQVSVPPEVFDQVYFAAAREVAAEARAEMKAGGIPDLVADTVADRLLSELPDREPEQAADTN